MDVSDMQVNFLEYVKVLGGEPKNTVSTFLEKTTTKKEVDSFSNCGTCYRREDRMLWDKIIVLAMYFRLMW